MTNLTMQFLRKPLTTGAICPSFPDLSRLMTSNIGIEKAKVVVELGPGTGAITRFILEKLQKESIFFAVELNESVLPVFKERFPDQDIYNESASNLPEILKRRGLSTADVILSGLPWASFSSALQDEILTAILKALPEDGAFATFAYLQGTILPTGIKFRKKLKQYFSRVETSRIAWLNIPPAFVYRCWK